jgi:hypothetical protein
MIIRVLLIIQKLEILFSALFQLNNILNLTLGYVILLNFLQSYLKVFLIIRLQVSIIKVDSKHEIFVDL